MAGLCRRALLLECMSLRIACVCEVMGGGEMSVGWLGLGRSRYVWNRDGAKPKVKASLSQTIRSGSILCNTENPQSSQNCVVRNL